MLFWRRYISFFFINISIIIFVEILFEEKPSFHKKFWSIYCKVLSVTWPTSFTVVKCNSEISIIYHQIRFRKCIINRFSIKKLFKNISQYSQENTCVSLFLNKIADFQSWNFIKKTQWTHLCGFAGDSTSKFHVESSSRFHQFWKANPCGNYDIDSTWKFFFKIKEEKIIFIHNYLDCCKIPKGYTSSSSSISDYVNLVEMTSTHRYTRLA